jgi:hypothetical protein
MLLDNLNHSLKYLVVTVFLNAFNAHFLGISLNTFTYPSKCQAEIKGSIFINFGHGIIFG